MAYEIPPDVARLIQDWIVRGGYESQDEVLRDALRALEEMSYIRPEPIAGHITSVEQLRSEIAQGLEQLDRGEGRDSEVVLSEVLRGLERPPIGR